MTSRVALAELDDCVHELCQPLTALQCRLEIAEMKTGVIDGSSECLQECARMNRTVAKLRLRLQQLQKMTEA